jgi:hypothetical protein
MEINYIIIAIKIFIFVSIINVWFFRFGKPSPWRAGSAASMKDEFKAYGLSETVMYVVGGIKVFFAILLVLSIQFEILAVPAAAGMGIMMLGAIFMHLKVKDPIKKSFPAFSFLVLSALIILFHNM